MYRAEDALKGYNRRLAITASRLCYYNPIDHLTLPSDQFWLTISTDLSRFPRLASSNVTTMSLRPSSQCPPDSSVADRAGAFAAVSPRLAMLSLLASGGLTNCLQDCTFDQPLTGLRSIKLRNVRLRGGLAAFSGMPALRSLDLSCVYLDRGAPPDALPASLTYLAITSEEPLPEIVTPPALRFLVLAGSIRGADPPSRATVTSRDPIFLHLSSVDALHAGPSALMHLTSLTNFYLDSVGGPLYRDVVGPMWRAIPSLRKVTLCTEAGQSWQWHETMLDRVIEQRMQMIEAGRHIATGRHTRKAVWGMVGSAAALATQGHVEREMQIVFHRIPVSVVLRRLSSVAICSVSLSPSAPADSPGVPAAGSPGAGISSPGRPPSPPASPASLPATTASPPPAAPSSPPPIRPGWRPRPCRLPAPSCRTPP